ncbi:MAG: hypothetical protein ACKO9Z_00200 [Planctomycetota bacterium]
MKKIEDESVRNRLSFQKKARVGGTVGGGVVVDRWEQEKQPKMKILNPPKPPKQSIFGLKSKNGKKNLTEIRAGMAMGTIRNQTQGHEI